MLVPRRRKALGVRHRLITVLLFGMLVSAISLFAVVRLLSTSARVRVERAREGLREEVERLARGNPGALVLEPPTSGIFGVRGGVWDGLHRPDVMPIEWASALASVTERARVAGQTQDLEVALGARKLVVVAKPLPLAPPAYAWAGFAVQSSVFLRDWERAVAALAVATALLVASTVHAMVTMHRGAAALQGALSALATDLSAPIPRPAIRELADVADGVASLADNLATARREEARLAQELSRNERLTALGRVAAGIAHEVRNPLASIKLRLDLTSHEAALPEGVRRAIHHATSEIERLDRLVADLLVVAGRATGPRRPIALGTLARGRVELLVDWAHERGVELAVEVAHEAQGIRVRIDADAVARALDNLLRNAVEAAPVPSRVDVAVTADARWVRVSVRDRGPGVLQDRQAELFEPFFTTKAEGTGLGLAITRAVARAHQGEVTYERRHDRTCFELSLPADGEPAEVVT